MPRRLRTDARFFESLEQRSLMAAGPAPMPPAPPHPAPPVVINASTSGQFVDKTDLHAVLGSTPVDFMLDGPGSGKVKFVNGGFVVNLTGTTEDTKVSIHAHPTPPNSAQPAIRAINVPKSLDHLDIDKVRIVGTIGIGGTANKLDLGDVANSTITVSGVGDKLDVNVGTVTSTSLISATPLHDVHAKSWTGSGAATSVQAPYAHDIHSDGALSVGILMTGTDDQGNSMHDLHAQGAAGTIVAKGDLHDVEVGSMSAGRINVAGSAHNLHIKGNLASSSIAIHNISDLHIDGNVTNSQIAAGAAFGNATLAQIFTAAKTLRWNDGSIDSLEVQGNVSSSSFTAGTRPVIGLWRDGNDQFVAGATGGFDHIEIHGTFLSSGFEAPSFPDKAKIAGKDVNTATDARFNSHLS